MSLNVKSAKAVRAVVERVAKGVVKAERRTSLPQAEKGVLSHPENVLLIRAVSRVKKVVGARVCDSPVPG
jgi:hypothetical protein